MLDEKGNLFDKPAMTRDVNVLEEVLCVRFSAKLFGAEQSEMGESESGIYLIYEDEMLKVKVLKAAAPSNGTNRLILRESNTYSQT